MAMVTPHFGHPGATGSSMTSVKTGIAEDSCCASSTADARTCGRVEVSSKVSLFTPERLVIESNPNPC
jgi:hypothetical protein